MLHVTFLRRSSLFSLAIGLIAGICLGAGTLHAQEASTSNSSVDSSRAVQSTLTSQVSQQLNALGAAITTSCAGQANGTRQTGLSCPAQMEGTYDRVCISGNWALERSNCKRALSCSVGGNTYAHGQRWASTAANGGCAAGTTGQVWYQCVDGTQRVVDTTDGDAARRTTCSRQECNGISYTNLACPQTNDGIAMAGVMSFACTNNVLTMTGNSCRPNQALPCGNVQHGAQQNFSCSLWNNSLAGTVTTTCNNGSNAITGFNCTYTPRACTDMAHGERRDVNCATLGTYLQGTVQMTCNDGVKGIANPEQCVHVNKPCPPHQHGESWQVSNCAAGYEGSKSYSCTDGRTSQTADNCTPRGCPPYPHNATWNVGCQGGYSGQITNNCQFGTVHQVANTCQPSGCSHGGQNYAHGQAWSNACGAGQTGNRNFRCDFGNVSETGNDCRNQCNDGGTLYNNGQIWRKNDCGPSDMGDRAYQCDNGNIRLIENTCQPRTCNWGGQTYANGQTWNGPCGGGQTGSIGYRCDSGNVSQTGNDCRNQCNFYGTIYNNGQTWSSACGSGFTGNRNYQCNNGTNQETGNDCRAYCGDHAPGTNWQEACINHGRPDHLGIVEFTCDNGNQREVGNNCRRGNAYIRTACADGGAGFIVCNRQDFFCQDSTNNMVVPANYCVDNGWMSLNGYNQWFKNLSGIRPGSKIYGPMDYKTPD